MLFKPTDSGGNAKSKKMQMNALLKLSHQKKKSIPKVR